MTAQPGAQELRAMIRELIIESLPAAAEPEQSSPTVPEFRTVVLATDGDVSNFVHTIITMLDDPLQSQRLRRGTISFRLSQTSPDAQRPLSAAASVDSSAAVRVERGAVTEKIVTAAAADNRAIVVSPRAVLTPLAREKARKLGVDIVRET
ncbi:hypothetical protein BVC93_24805 [Mycobacterium sp. MS1601]|uniref:hypothetical protein n=1 Tax=Mycobacterium sp. MS1601 TaxID=1936029 RepID=UPI000979372B|nr:hypothetical protein [Mycobacterium sp. MS1601]AQA05088.1 hypothetical protein BVC93_24805 [Mycobacterium sp. MS1601]